MEFRERISCIPKKIIKIKRQLQYCSTLVCMLALWLGTTHDGNQALMRSNLVFFSLSSFLPRHICTEFITFIEISLGTNCSVDSLYNNSHSMPYNKNMFDFFVRRSKFCHSLLNSNNSTHFCRRKWCQLFVVVVFHFFPHNLNGIFHQWKFGIYIFLEWRLIFDCNL